MGTKSAIAREEAMLVLFYTRVITVVNTVSFYIHDAYRKNSKCSGFLTFLTKKCSVFDRHVSKPRIDYYAMRDL